MHPVGPLDLDRVPANVLFPEEYRASCWTIVKDFAFFGTWITGFVVMLAWTMG